MIANARLISHTPLKAPDGRGEPVFGLNTVGAVMPACQVVEPARRRVDDQSADTVQADMVVIVPLAAFGGVVVGTGDRVAVRMDGLLGCMRTGDVLGVRRRDGSVIELSLTERVDLAETAGGGA
jgi:hypothetical protein